VFRIEPGRGGKFVQVLRVLHEAMDLPRRVAPIGAHSHDAPISAHSRVAPIGAHSHDAPISAHSRVATGGNGDP
jgi:hypothetical protein